LLTAVLGRQAAAAVGVWERVGRGKLLLRCRLLAAQGISAPTGGERRAPIVVAARLQLVFSILV